jgi:hypothetical protein
MRELKKVEIVWRDAFDGPQGWVVLGTYEVTPCIPKTIGYLVDSAEHGPLLEGHITVCSSYYEADGELVISNPIHIPNGMMVSIKHVA